MALYVYRCGTCGEEHDKQYPIGTALRITRCHCGGTMRLRIGTGVNISAHALETKGGPVRDVDAREDRWHKDMPAYKRMRHRGLQPQAIDGSAALEDKVGDQFDVMHQPMYEAGVSRTHMVEAAEQAKQIAQEGVPL